ncbi:hypothetical protein BKA69DRAFT_1123788 [Paraphysoderma sedebokerense]|nr:hypothetical protein BKA69DRAFT_1123788 [Paraphysoderma sedebokerense]
MHALSPLSPPNSLFRKPMERPRKKSDQHPEMVTNLPYLPSLHKEFDLMEVTKEACDRITSTSSQIQKRLSAYKQTMANSPYLKEINSTLSTYTFVSKNRDELNNGHRTMSEREKYGDNEKTDAAIWNQKNEGQLSSRIETSDASDQYKTDVFSMDTSSPIYNFSEQTTYTSIQEIQMKKATLENFATSPRPEFVTPGDNLPLKTSSIVQKALGTDNHLTHESSRKVSTN